jgi:hypothetical protein
MLDEENRNRNEDDSAFVQGNEGGSPSAEEPAAVCEPSGPPQPLAKKPTTGCGCGGTALALLLVGGAGLLFFPLLCGGTMGATRSVRLEHEKRVAEIDAAMAEAQSVAPTQENSSTPPNKPEQSK